MTKKSKLGLAVAAALSIGASVQSVQAANIATNGVGELVYIPYYSTTGGKVSFVRLTNHSFETLAVKLKVREGTNSEDARDFHLFLSPRDVWTASISSVNGVVTLHTNDTSCTVPSKDRGWNGSDAVGYSIDVPAVGLTDSAEGYVVAQVMGASDGRQPTQGSLFDAVSLMQHQSNGVPVDCHAVSAAFDLRTDATLGLRDPAGYDSLRSQFTEPTNSLSGAAAIVNPATGTLTALPVTAVANVYNPGPAGDATSGYTENGAADFPNDTIQLVADQKPDEQTDVTPRSATIYDDAAETLVTLDTLNTLPVSAALMTSSLSNYIDTTGGNSWVVTFPTKKHHLGTPCSAPFPADCSADVTSIRHTVRNSGALSYVTNEEESEFATPDSDQICFSGPDFAQNCTSTNEGSVTLPTEVNVVTFGDSNGNPLASGLTTNISSDFLGGIVLGWMQMRFTDAQPVSGLDVNGTQTTLFGLPAIGFGYAQYDINGVTATMTQPYTFTSPLNQ